MVDVLVSNPSGNFIPLRVRVSLLRIEWDKVCFWYEKCHKVTQLVECKFEKFKVIGSSPIFHTFLV